MLRAAERAQMKDGKLASRCDGILSRELQDFCSLSSTPVTSHHKGDISPRSNEEAEPSFEFCPVSSGSGPNPVTFN